MAKEYQNMDQFLTQLTDELATKGSQDDAVREMVSMAQTKHPEWCDIAQTAIHLRQAFEAELRGERPSLSASAVKTTVHSSTAAHSSGSRSWGKLSLPTFSVFASLLVVLVGVAGYYVGSTNYLRQTASDVSGPVAGLDGGSTVDGSSDSVDPNPTTALANIDTKDVKRVRVIADIRLPYELRTGSEAAFVELKDSGPERANGWPTSSLAIVGGYGRVIPLPADDQGVITKENWDRWFHKLEGVNARVQEDGQVEQGKLADLLAPLYREQAGKMDLFTWDAPPAIAPAVGAEPAPDGAD